MVNIQGYFVPHSPYRLTHSTLSSTTSNCESPLLKPIRAIICLFPTIPIYILFSAFVDRIISVKTFSGTKLCIFYNLNKVSRSFKFLSAYLAIESYVCASLLGIGIFYLAFSITEMQFPVINLIVPTIEFFATFHATNFYPERIWILGFF